MEFFRFTITDEDDDDPDPGTLFTSARDLPAQATISVILGLFAFLTFCVSPWLSPQALLS